MFKKKKKKIAPENMKKLPSKVAHNQPRPFFFSTGLTTQMAQKQKSRTTKSALMQDWVFRLGLQPIHQKNKYIPISETTMIDPKEKSL